MLFSCTVCNVRFSMISLKISSLSLVFSSLYVYIEAFHGFLVISFFCIFFLGIYCFLIYRSFITFRNFQLLFRYFSALFCLVFLVFQSHMPNIVNKVSQIKEIFPNIFFSLLFRLYNFKGSQVYLLFFPSSLNLEN